METLELSKGVNMPVLGYGTFQANGDEFEKAIEAALEAGYRHIDTAAYYENEHIIGKVLARWFKSGKLTRKDLFIVTKLPACGMREEQVEMFLTKSIKDMGISYVDVYLIHMPFAFNYVKGNFTPFTSQGKIDIDTTTDHLAIWRKMEDMQMKGLTKAIGISNFNRRQIQRILDNCTIRPTNLQIELNTYFQQDKLVNFCKKNNIIVTAYSPLGAPGVNAFLTQFGGKEVKLQRILEDPVVNKIAKKHGKTPANVVLKHIVQRGIAVIPKSTNPQRLRQNFDIFNFVLDDEDNRELKSLNKNLRLFDFLNFTGIEKHPEYSFYDEY